MKHSLLLQDSTSFEDVVEALDQGGIGFLALVDGVGFLQGIVTDGDVRRALLKKDYTVNAMINKTPEVADVSTNEREIVARLKALHRRHMPLVSGEGKFKGVFSLDQIEFVSRSNKVVIMAGGLGSRLGELTKNIPKPMLTVGNKPMLLHLVELFSEQGFREFIFCVNYKKEIIQNYFKCGKEFGVKISYIEENKRLGTAGALSLIKRPVSEPFFVINADILTHLDFTGFLEAHLENTSVASMRVRQHTYQVPFGVVNSDDSSSIINIDEKPTYSFDVNAGIYLLNPDVIDKLPINEYFDMPSLFESLVDEGYNTSVYRVDDYWIDIGRKEDLQKANLDMNGYLNDT